MRELVYKQKVDPSNNLVFPWFTHPFLEVLDRWDLENKTVLEYGGGRSTAWWRKKCRFVLTIEAKDDFAYEIQTECEENGLNAKGYIVCDTEWREGDRRVERSYVKAHEHLVDTGSEYQYDIVAVDGIFRYECMIEGISLLSERGGMLIIDNWHQDGFLCPACEELVKDYEGYVFPQADHEDHHGNCWKTAYFVIPSKA